MKKAKKIYQGVVTCLTIVFFILAIYIIIGGTVAVKNNDMFSIFGYTYSVVPSKSMEPEIHVGDSVIAKKVKYDTLAIGDDVIYYSESLDIYIVHRIIRYDEGLGFKTKGINNSTEDKDYVTENNFISKVTWHGNASNIGTLVLNHRGTIFLVLTAILLLIAINGIFDIVNIIHKDKLEKLEREKEELAVKETPDKEALRQEVLKELEEEKQNEQNKKDE